ncbi:WD repeat-containing protein 41 isoform X3 [Lingula anatina]|uniref:WD repeat-containing protein 41 isoform X3 n=1 Tax=Lingula anatina TaxID=7574 RepID=A0A1S3J4C5_LINAN|nr:WD repeat-containing protein 41 isoform X3 [Lingula anatina]|eukprot:XP_013405116.1 WD repeat-containing protein 41 isoform X3 [Lingula anatina]
MAMLEISDMQLLNSLVKNVDMVEDAQPCNLYREVLILQHHTDIVRALVKVDDHRCISAGDDCTAALWDIEDGRKLNVFSGHKLPINCILLLKPEPGSYDDILLITGASDKHIKVWNIETGQCLEDITEHNSSVKCLASLPAFDIFISGGEKLCAWSRKGKQLHQVENPGKADIQFLLPIKENRFVAACEESLYVYTVEYCGDSCEIKFFKHLFRQHREAIGSLINVPDGSFASGSLDGLIVLWSSHTLSAIRQFNQIKEEKEFRGIDNHYPFSIQHMISPEKGCIFAAVGNSIYVFDITKDQGRIIAKKQDAHMSKIKHMDFLYHGLYLATCSEDGAIKLWGRAPAEKNDKDYFMNPLETFTGLSSDKIRKLKKSETVEPCLLGECLGHSGAVQLFVDFGEEGFVSCGGDGLLILWKDGVLQNLKRSQFIGEMTGATQSSYTCSTLTGLSRPIFTGDDDQATLRTEESPSD